MGYTGASCETGESSRPLSPSLPFLSPTPPSNLLPHSGFSGIALGYLLYGIHRGELWVRWVLPPSLPFRNKCTMGYTGASYETGESSRPLPFPSLQWWAIFEYKYKPSQIFKSKYKWFKKAQNSNPTLVKILKSKFWGLKTRDGTSVALFEISDWIKVRTDKISAIGYRLWPNIGHISVILPG